MDKIKENEMNKNKLVTRQSIVVQRNDKAELDFVNGLEALATTSDPALVLDWGRYEVVREILPMRYCIIPLDNKAPLLDSHNSRSVDNIKGTAFDFITNETELNCKIIISEAEPEIKTKIKERTIEKLSLGYLTQDNYTVEIPKGASITIDGVEYKNEYDDYPMLVRTWWKIKEVSLVPFAADENAKIRNEILEKMQNLIDNNVNNKINILINERLKQMEEPILTTVPDHERVQGIRAYYDTFKNVYKKGEKGLVEALKNPNITVDQFREDVFNNLDDSKPVSAVETIGMGEQEIKRFSITRAIAAASDNNWSKAGFEKEVIDAASEKNHRGKGLVLPNDIFLSHIKRSMVVGTNEDGGYLKGTSHLGSEFIELLRNKLVTGQAGIRILTGLVGDVDIPKQVAAATLGWSTETTSEAASKMTLGQVKLSPKEADGTISYSRGLLLQSDPSIDNLIMTDLLNIKQIGVDKVVLHGLGASNQPKGVALTEGIGSVNCAGVSWDSILEFEEDVAVANADINTLKWITNPSVRRILKSTPQVANFPLFLMQEGKVNGYEALITNQVDSGYLFFGDWSQVILGEWGATEFLVTPNAANKKLNDVTIFCAVDVAVRHAGAFAVSSNVSAAS